MRSCALLALGCFAVAEDAASTGAGAAPRDPSATTGPAALTGIAHPFDPYRGMERNGLIPKVKLPDDVPNPDRWRYVPEGRLKPGNVLERFMVSSFASPIVYYEEAVGAGGGISLTDIDFREQRRREFLGLFAARSTLGQEGYSLVWQRWTEHRDLPAGGVIQEERSFMRLVGGYNRTLTRRFFGFGPDSPDSAETSYTDEIGFAEALWQTSLPRAGDDTVLDLGAQWQHHNLYKGHVPRRPSTEDDFPALVAHDDSHDALWLTGGLRWDTRDSQHNPYRGWTTGLTIDAAPLQSGGQSGALGTWRSSVVIPVPGLLHDGGSSDEENPPTDVLAIGGFLEWTMGDLPYYDLPSLGGPYTLRAYIADRFTDRAAWHASAEYRLWVIPRGFAVTDSIRVERLGIAPFYELGTVAPSVSDLGNARVHQSYGVGLRAMLERTAVFRVDFGWAPDSFGFNVAYGTSF
jgi:hypothetical protein